MSEKKRKDALKKASLKKHLKKILACIEKNNASKAAELEALPLTQSIVEATAFLEENKFFNDFSIEMEVKLFHPILEKL